MKDLEEKHRFAQDDIASFKRQVRFLKRERKDNIPPSASLPSPTKILARPQSPKVVTASQASASPTRSDSPSLLQPAAKKSRSRKARWDNAPAISSSDNVDEKEKQPLPETTRQSKAAVACFGVQDRPSFNSQDTLDPVLLASLTSFRTKHDINAEIDTSSETLKLGRNRNLVFHRDTVADQVAVTRKALAYAEVILTNNCRNAAAKQARSERRGNDVMAYLDTLSRRNVTQLFQRETADALESMEDARRSMATSIYQDGHDLHDRIQESCFTANGNRLQPKAPHTQADLNERLHERLLCYNNQHSIPIGFYHAKWLEKINFYIGQSSRDSSPPGTSVSNTPVPTPQKSSSSSIASSSAAKLVTHESMHSLMKKRAAIFDDREDNQLKVKDRSVVMYRSNRLVHWVKTQEEAEGLYMTEEGHDAQYDQEQLNLVHAAMARINKNTTKTQQKLGDGPAGQGHR
jgi:hypothetical protein